MEFYSTPPSPVNPVGVNRSSVLHLYTMVNAVLSVSVAGICVGKHSSQFPSPEHSGTMLQGLPSTPIEQRSQATVTCSSPLRSSYGDQVLPHIIGRRSFFPDIISVPMLTGSHVKLLLTSVLVKGFTSQGPEVDPSPDRTYQHPMRVGAGKRL